MKAINAHIGEVEMKAITPSVIESMLDSMRDGETLSGKPASERSLHGLCVLIKSIMADAFRRGVIPHNPLEEMRLPTYRERPRRALNETQCDALAKKLDISDGYQLAVLLCLTCGLRCGEAVGLDWEDYDGFSITISKALDHDGNVQLPKTDASYRSIPVPQDVRARLDAIRGYGRMCRDSYGRDIKPYWLSHWWCNHKEDFGVSVGLHELRHSYLTRLANAGVHPRIMQTLAGHATLSITMQVYTHVSDEMQRQAIDSAFA